MMQTQQGWLSGWARQCYQCGKTWDSALMHRRPVITVTQTVHLWWRFRPLYYTWTQVQSLCPYCTHDHDAAQQVQRQKRILLIGGTGLGFFSWLYLGTTGLFGAIAVIVAGLLYNRRARNSLPQIRRNS